MLDRKKMMLAFREKQIEGPKGGVTKRKAAGSDATGATAGGSAGDRQPKKPKRTLPPHLQEVLDGKGVANVPATEEIPSSDEEGNSPLKAGNEQPITVEAGDQEREVPEFAVEICPGVKSIAGGFREPLKQPSDPQGEMGWSTLDMRTYKGWTGDGPRPLDTLRAFNIPSDIQYYRDLGPREFARELREKAGEVCFVYFMFLFPFIWLRPYLVNLLCSLWRPLRGTRSAIMT